MNLTETVSKTIFRHLMVTVKWLSQFQSNAMLTRLYLDCIHTEANGRKFGIAWVIMSKMTKILKIDFFLNL